MSTAVSDALLDQTRRPAAVAALTEVIDAEVADKSGIGGAAVKAGYAAVKDCSASTKVVLHLANGGDNGAFQWWFDNITAQGVEFDVIAASYYGYWHGSLGDLQYNLNDMIARYGKDVLVVETAYPFTLGYEDAWPNIIGLPEQLVAGRLRPPLLALDAALEALYQHARRLAHESEAVAQAGRRVHRLREELGLILDGQRGHVLWLESRGARSALGASPVEVGEILRERLFDERKGVVLTSATLSTGGSFAFAKQRLGIDFEVDELSLPSPFDYPRQAALYLPRHLPEPREPEFVEQAAREILSLIELTGGGAFVLCTSLRMMQRLHEACAPRLAKAR